VINCLKITIRETRNEIKGGGIEIPKNPTIRKEVLTWMRRKC
tara:strand:+ start:480 stop:605 length:126 start_codon:yes stop_codon:yes gene_type:complete